MPRLLRLCVLLTLAAGPACERKLPEQAQQSGADADRVTLTNQQVAGAHLTIAPVEERAIDEVVNTSGKVAFDDLRVSHVFSPVTGRVTKILAQPGQRVKKGDPLVVIESPDVGSAFADLDKAQADLVAAEHDFKRQKELFEAHAAAEKDYEAAQDNFRKAQAEVARAQQKARLFRSGSVDKVSQEYTLRALIDGEVVARNVNPGVEVQGQYSGGNAVELFTIGELDQVWVMADLFEVDLARVQVGAHAEISVVGYPNHPFAGKVAWIASTLDPATRTAKVRIDVANPDRSLKPEMFASVAMGATGHRALTVPRSAVLHLGEQTVVYVQSAQDAQGHITFQRRPVSVDEDASRDQVPVLRGLVAGEKVVSGGAILLSEMGQS